MIVGGSGSGKSSLALAGILPKLKSTHTNWQFVPPFTPGAKPFESLASALAKATGNSVDALTIQESLRQLPKRADEKLGELFGGDKQILFLIDQFEELLTLCQEEHEQKAFSDLLYGLVTHSDSTCRVLLTLRTDHLARFETNPSFRDLYRLVSSDNTSQLAAMDFASIHQAIEIPAKKIGLRFLPPTIIDALASQTASLVDGLPLLQFALQRLWDERPTSQPIYDEKDNLIEPAHQLDFINEELLKKLPDVQSALGKVAEDLYQLLDKEKQILCQRLMQELVLLDENFEQPLRRRRSKIELLNILSRRWPETAVNEVIDSFVNKGLLRYSGGSEAQYLEVAHEALFRNWPTFREWISGEKAKTRLHAIKLIGREALDWRTHECSPDYLKLTGAPLKSAQAYLDDDWLVDKDSTDYLEACLKQEQEKEAQRQQAEHAKELAQKAEKLEVQRKIEIAEANAKTQKKNKWIVLISALAVIFCGLLAGGFLWSLKIEEEHKSAALNSLPLINSKLQPNPLDIAYTVAKKGGEDFRYVLAQGLEDLKDRYLFSPRESNVVIAGQGTAIFQFDRSDPTKEKLKVFRVCQDGRVEDNFAEISYLVKDRQLAQLLEIAPPNIAGEYDTRLLVLPFKRYSGGWEVEIYQLNWPVRCENISLPQKSKDEPKKIAVKVLDNVNEISPFAFDASVHQIVFSAISFPKNSSPTSSVWLFDGDGSKKDWTPIDIKTDKLTLEQKEKNEDVVSAVAFREEKPGPSPEQRLITGRLNGALYCGDQRLDKNPDRTRVSQVFTNYRKSRAEVGNWFVYRHHESESLIARQCESNKEDEMIFTKSAEEGKNISFVSMDYVRDETDKSIKPVVVYIKNNHPTCWIREQKEKEWNAFDCNPNYIADQAVISADEKRLITIEPGVETTKAAVHRIYQEFLRSNKIQWVGKSSGVHLILWSQQQPTRSKAGQSQVLWKKLDRFKGYKAELTASTDILDAAISPKGNYIAWLQRESASPNDVDFFIRNTESGEEIEQKVVFNFQTQKIETFTLAVNDDGLIVLANNEILRLFKINGKDLKNLPLMNKEIKGDRDPKITCLAFSPDNKYLVNGTKGGELKRFNIINQSSLQPIEQPIEYKEKRIQINSPVTACGVDNNETIVAGFLDGNVGITTKNKNEPMELIMLDQRMNRINTPVKAVNINLEHRYFAALFDRQTDDCSSRGLSGQAIRIWGEFNNEKKTSQLITNICLPNRRISTIGSLMEQDNKIFLPVAFDDGVEELILCQACANKNENPTAVLKRLLGEAENKGAKLIIDSQLEHDYGIKF